MSGLSFSLQNDYWLNRLQILKSMLPHLALHIVQYSTTGIPEFLIRHVSSVRTYNYSSYHQLTPCFKLAHKAWML